MSLHTNHVPTVFINPMVADETLCTNLNTRMITIENQFHLDKFKEAVSAIPTHISIDHIELVRFANAVYSEFNPLLNSLVTKEFLTLKNAETALVSLMSDIELFKSRVSNLTRTPTYNDRLKVDAVTEAYELLPPASQKYVQSELLLLTQIAKELDASPNAWYIDTFINKVNTLIALPHNEVSQHDYDYVNSLHAHMNSSSRLAIASHKNLLDSRGTIWNQDDIVAHRDAKMFDDRIVSSYPGTKVYLSSDSEENINYKVELTKLSLHAQNYVRQKHLLISAGEKIEVVKHLAAAKTVDDEIKGLNSLLVPTTSNIDGSQGQAFVAAVKAARGSLSKLSDKPRMLVINTALLKSKEDMIELIQNTVKANSFKDEIATIPATITLTHEALITGLVGKYNALPLNIHYLISNSSVLLIAKEKLQVLLDAANKTTFTDGLLLSIYTSIDTTYKNKVVEMRKAYNNLNITDKSKVIEKEYSQLLHIEGRIEADKWDTSVINNHTIMYELSDVDWTSSTTLNKIADFGKTVKLLRQTYNSFTPGMQAQVTKVNQLSGQEDRQSAFGFDTEIIELVNKKGKTNFEDEPDIRFNAIDVIVNDILRKYNTASDVVKATVSNGVQLFTLHADLEQEKDRRAIDKFTKPFITFKQGIWIEEFGVTNPHVHSGHQDFYSWTPVHIMTWDITKQAYHKLSDKQKDKLPLAMTREIHIITSMQVKGMMFINSTNLNKELEVYTPAYLSSLEPTQVAMDKYVGQENAYRLLDSDNKLVVTHYQKLVNAMKEWNSKKAKQEASVVIAYINSIVSSSDIKGRVDSRDKYDNLRLEAQHEVNNLQKLIQYENIANDEHDTTSARSFDSAFVQFSSQYPCAHMRKFHANNPVNEFINQTLAQGPGGESFSISLCSAAHPFTSNELYEINNKRDLNNLYVIYHKLTYKQKLKATKIDAFQNYVMDINCH